MQLITFEKLFYITNVGEAATFDFYDFCESVSWTYVFLLLFRFQRDINGLLTCSHITSNVTLWIRPL